MVDYIFEITYNNKFIRGEVKTKETEIEEVIKRINEFLQEQLWMDFEIIEYSKLCLKIIGSIDISNAPTMELILRDVFFISAPLNWQTDTSKNVITLLKDEDAKKINLQFQVEQGYHIIKIDPEDYPSSFGCLFGVKELFFNLL